MPTNGNDFIWQTKTGSSKVGNADRREQGIEDLLNGGLQSLRHVGLLHAAGLLPPKPVQPRQRRRRADCAALGVARHVGVDLRGELPGGLAGFFGAGDLAGFLALLVLSGALVAAGLQEQVLAFARERECSLGTNKVNL